jgi:hypothetical protein
VPFVVAAQPFLPSGSPSSVPSSCYPSIGLVALHAGVTVRDSEIETSDGGQGGDGGEPQRGGRRAPERRRQQG